MRLRLITLLTFCLALGTFSLAQAEEPLPEAPETPSIESESSVEIDSADPVDDGTASLTPDPQPEPDWEPDVPVEEPQADTTAESTSSSTVDLSNWTKREKRQLIRLANLNPCGSDACDERWINVLLATGFTASATTPEEQDLGIKATALIVSEFFICSTSQCELENGQLTESVMEVQKLLLRRRYSDLATDLGDIVKQYVPKEEAPDNASRPHTKPSTSSASG